MDTFTVDLGWESHDSGSDAAFHNWHYDAFDGEQCAGSPNDEAPWDFLFTPIRTNTYPKTFRYSAFVVPSWIVDRRVTHTVVAGYEAFVNTSGSGGFGQTSVMRTYALDTISVEWRWRWVPIAPPPGGGNGGGSGAGF